MAFAVGDIVGGCEIVARLKAGGMATLYLARREGVSGFSRQVAIKVVHDHLAEDEEFVRMFVNEALLQSRISHPNVVHVEELGRDDEQHFLVMEYVHGCSLSQLLKELAKRDRALPYELSVSVALQVLAGLHAAHELREEDGGNAGVVHRDVSPDNALLSYDGHVKLIDFGIAKVQGRATSTGKQLKGKLRYMSPEQASGREVDRRTDVYALGVVLWEMLTMKRLFTADDQFKLLEMVREPVIEPPSTYRSDVPHALEAIVMRALSVSPDDRFSTAAEMRLALAEACPRALLADGSQLAELLSVAMAAQIAKSERLASPGATSLPPEPPAEDGEAALLTMTISATGFEFLDAADPSHSATGPRLGGAPAAAAAPAGYVAASSVAREAEDAGGTSRGLRVAVAAVVVAGLACGVAFGLLAMNDWEEPSGIRVAPLPSRGASISGGEPPVAAAPPAAVSPTPSEEPEPVPQAPGPAAIEPERSAPEAAAVEPEPAEPAGAEPEPVEVREPSSRRRRRSSRAGTVPTVRPLERRSRDLPLADEF